MQRNNCGELSQVKEGCNPHKEESWWIQSRIHKKKPTLTFMIIKLYKIKDREKLKITGDFLIKKMTIRLRTNLLWRLEERKQNNSSRVLKESNCWPRILQSAKLSFDSQAAEPLLSYTLTETAGRAEVLTLGCASESLWGCVKIQTAGPTPKLLIFSRSGLGPQNVHF